MPCWRAFMAWLKSSWIGWLFGFDLDPTATSPTAKRLAFSDKDGYSVFNALAGFGLAQAAALTVVARGEEYKLLVLGIYVVAVVATLAWTIAMLRTERASLPPATGSLRAYDEPTIGYGRWVVGWTFIVSAILLFLGYQGLLPNQTPRVHFGATAIECATYDDPADWPTSGGQQQQLMDEWMTKLDSAQREKEKEGFFLIIQKTPFPDSYKPFAVDLKCDPKFTLGLRTAFLVQPARNGYRPVYRQIPFRKPENKVMPGVDGDTMDVADANRGEYLLILLFAKPIKGQDKPSKRSLGIRLTPNFPGNDGSK